MNTAIGRMGVLYGKLGLSTPEAIIAARGRGIESAAKVFGQEHLTDVLACAFQFGMKDEPVPLAEKFSDEDSTFDVRQTDQEGGLIASTLLSYEMQSGSDFAAEVALAFVTASFGGIRKQPSDPEIAGIADKMLANAQSRSTKAPERFTFGRSPKTLTDAMAQIPESGAVDGSVVRIVSAELQKYAETRALASTTNANALFEYVSALEEEMRTYWWVVNGWSDTKKSPFRDLELIPASLLAGLELATKTSLPTGLFAAPALCDMVLQVGRTEIGTQTTLAAAAKSLAPGWRKAEFGEIAESGWAPWLPLSTAMGLAAISNDEPDWEPRFRRITGLNSKVRLKPLELSVQMYRERLVARQYF